MAHQETQLFEDEPALTQCLPQLNELRISGKLTDLTIELQDNVRLRAHKIVLASRVPSLCDSLCEAPMKDQNVVVQWPKVSSEVAEPLLEYIYTGQLEVQEAIATGLIVLSQQLEMAQIEAWVVSFMAARLNSDNLSNNWGLSELMKSDQLREACLQHIKATFEATVATDFFVQLQPETVLYLLRADDLQVSNEESVLKAIGRWLNPLDEVDKTRLVHVEAMMREVRWNQIDTDLRSRLFDDDEGFWNNRLLGRIMMWIESPSSRAIRQCPFNERPRWRLNSTEDNAGPSNENRHNPLDNICLLGQFGSNWMLAQYNANTNTYEKLTDATSSYYTTYVNIGVYIYAIGEDPSVGTRTKVDKFDTRKRQWSECAAILTDRTHYAAVAVPVDEEGVICVCGGEIKVNFQSETSETCELYLPQEDRWYALPGLNQSRKDAVSVALPDGRVFVIGGYHNIGTSWYSFSSVEACHLQKPADWRGKRPASDAFWKTIAPTPSSCQKGAAVAFRGRIFVVGASVDDPVEVFSPPDDRLPLGQWTALANRGITYSNISFLVSQGRLFAFSSYVFGSNSLQEFVPSSSQSGPSRNKFDSWTWSDLGKVKDLECIGGAFLLDHQ